MSQNKRFLPWFALVRVFLTYARACCWEGVLVGAWVHLRGKSGAWDLPTHERPWIQSSAQNKQDKTISRKKRKMNAFLAGVSFLFSVVELAWLLSAPGSPPCLPHMYLSSFLSASLLGHDITTPLYTSPSLGDSATETHIYPKTLLPHTLPPSFCPVQLWTMLLF